MPVVLTAPEGGECLTINYFLSSFPAEANHCRYTALSQSPPNCYWTCWQVGLLSHVETPGCVWCPAWKNTPKVLHKISTFPKYKIISTCQRRSKPNSKNTDTQKKVFFGWCCCFLPSPWWLQRRVTNGPANSTLDVPPRPQWALQVSHFVFGKRASCWTE